MAARKKLVSTICIISLILAITAGVLLSVDAQSSNGSYGGNDVNLVNTGTAINLNVGTFTSDNGANKPADFPSDANKVMAIASQKDLGTFLDSATVTHGYLTTDIAVDWSGTGTNKDLKAGKVFDGNGHTVTLNDGNGTVNQYKDQFGQHADFTGGMDYGMFVAYNAGTIQNVKFKYNNNNTLTLKNDSGNLLPNYAGFVCGTNADTGVIANCDLDAYGNIRYEYNNGSLAIPTFPVGDYLVRKAFTVAFGGIAGRNAGLITNINAKYSGTTNVNNDPNCFDVSLNVQADNNSKKEGGGLITYRQRASAHAFAGGIVGNMYNRTSEVSNIVLTGDLALYMSAKPKQNSGGGGDEGKAWSYAIGGAVVGANSGYAEAEGDIGTGDSTQATIDNIIMNANVQYSGSLDMQENGDNSAGTTGTKSINGVVFCGKATNVTIINRNNRIVKSQNVDLQTDHCNCGTNTNPGEHTTGNANLINTDDHSNVKLELKAEFNDDGTPVLNEKGRQVYNQVITVTPNDPTNYVLGDFKFMKYTGKNEDADAEGNTTGLQTPKNEDTNGALKNDTTYLYTMPEVRLSSYTFKIEPYQGSAANYWQVDIYDYAIANISDADANLVPATDTTLAWAKEYTYNGFDFLTQQLKYVSKDGTKTGIVAPSGFNAISSGEDGAAVTSGRLPGEYSFTLQEKQYGLSYFNTAQRVVVFADDTKNLEPFTFKVNKAGMQVQGYTVEYINNNWFNEVTDFNYEIDTQKAQANAVNGYVYEVNGSKYTRSGLAFTNDTSTSTAGRTYTVYLTSGGVQVTDPITYTVRVDLENPILKITSYEHPDGRYYTHNRVSLNASDEHSGVDSIMMYNYDKKTGEQIGEPVDVIFACEDDNTGDNDLSYIDEETGDYVWYFSASGIIVIVVTDVAGLSVERELNVNIDNFTPTISVNAYFYEGYTDGEGNEQTRKSTYNSNDEVYSAVYFDATAQFGESGGVIQYSYDNVDWFTYTETVVVKVSSDIYFRAMSNAFDHTDKYPYKKMYQVHTFWSKNLTMDGTVQVVTPFKVKVEVEHVEITLNDIIVSNTTKVFDGTTYFDVANIQVKQALADQIEGKITFKAAYADVNASDSVAIKITADCPDDNSKVFDNNIEDVIGSITKKEISVVVDNKEKYFGYALPELTCTQIGMVPGFEETEAIKLYVDKGDFAEYSYELLPQSKRDDTNNGYVITVVEGLTFKNYTLPEANITTGILQIDLAPIDRLVYKKGEFTGLDTNNIAKRNLEIGFMRVTGDYQKLNVTFHRRVYDDSTGSLVTRWVLQRDIKTAPAGFYRVTISMPERTTIGNRVMADMYELDPSIATFMIKVIDAEKFVVDKGEDTQALDENKTEQAAPVINNNSAQPSDYEGNTASTDNTGAEIEPTAKKTRDYIVIISIFCAVAMMAAFGVGIGRAIVKRSAKR